MFIKQIEDPLCVRHCCIFVGQRDKHSPVLMLFIIWLKRQITLQCDYFCALNKKIRCYRTPSRIPAPGLLRRGGKVVVVWEAIWGSGIYPKI